MTTPGPIEGPGVANWAVQHVSIDPQTAYRLRRQVAIVSRTDVEHALSAVPRVERSGLGLPYGGRQTLASPRAYERERWFLSVSPGTVRVHRRLVAPKESLWDDDGVSDAASALRGAITEFSEQSRTNMFRTLPALDYSPMFAAGNATAAVTLTLPGRHWESLVPNLRVMAKMRAKFQQAYQRAWGAMPVAVWKLEFQRRGAPHLHLFMATPPGEARVRVGPRSAWSRRPRFMEWLGPTWARIVDPSMGRAHDDEDAFREHAMYGTRVDYAEGTRFSDPKRIAAYFSKHGVFQAKEYQNEIPEHWRAQILEDGHGGARFWGYWQLEKAEVTVELQPRRGAARRAAFVDGEPVRHYRERMPVDYDGMTIPHYVRSEEDPTPPPEQVVLMRHLRKLARAQSWIERREVPRMRVNVDTGEVRVRRRKVRRRRVLLAGQASGFLVVNDGAATAADCARLLGAPPPMARSDVELVA